ncbi:MAG: hypothetical protein J6S14_02590 [Clostridia bacterium]|nr:hypothetical protein [Clostridia bacterium]
MKKIISMILTLAFVLAALSAIMPNASAKSDTITEAEIVDLIERSWNFYRAAVRGWGGGDIADYKQEIKVNVFGAGEVSYYRVYEERLPGGSYEGMKEVAESIYYGDYLPEQMYKYPTYSSVYRYIPNYYVDKDGVVYTTIRKLDYEFVSLYGYEVTREENAEDRVSADSIEIKFIGGDADTASAYVRCNVGTKGEDTNHYWIRCDFKRADDGWRISGGPFVSMLRYNDFNMLDDWERELVLYDGIFAAEDEAPDYLSDDEAVKLLQKAFLIHCQTHNRIPLLGGSTSDDFYYNDDTRSAYYVLLDPTMLYGGSMDAFRTAVDEVYTEKAAESVYQAYCFEGYPLFVERDGKTYIAWGDAQRKVFSLVFEENNDYDFTVLERTPDKVTARISTTICLPGDEGYLDSYINCIFLKTADGWRIDDCAYTEMMTSIGFDDYVPIESPATGDNSFDTIALCLGGISIIISALCLVRRKREIL